MQNPPINNEQAAVVIPVYKNQLSYNEHFSLVNCSKVLRNYQLIAVAPHDMDMADFPSVEVFDQVKRFDPGYFKDIQGYNRLMLSSEFYQSFLEFEFILIHQLDALVFKDELSYWCNSGYDYIGAPWPREAVAKDIIKAIKIPVQTFFHIWQNKMKNGVPTDRQFDNRVGNGGLSLRRVKKFLNLTLQMPDEIDQYNKRTEHQFNEDVFWSIEVNRRFNRLKIPSCKKAFRFSIENFPQRGMQVRTANFRLAAMIGTITWISGILI